MLSPLRYWHPPGAHLSRSVCLRGRGQVLRQCFFAGASFIASSILHLPKQTEGADWKGSWRPRPTKTVSSTSVSYLGIFCLCQSVHWSGWYIAYHNICPSTWINAQNWPTISNFVKSPSSKKSVCLWQLIQVFFFCCCLFVVVSLFQVGFKRGIRPNQEYIQIQIYNLISPMC